RRRRRHRVRRSRRRGARRRGRGPRARRRPRRRGPAMNRTRGSCAVGVRGRWCVWLVAMTVASGCAAPAPPPPETPPAVAARPADAAVVEPPAFVPAPVAATPEARDDARRAARLAILDAAWKLVRDKHYDKTLGGVDWTAVRARYQPLALAAPTDAAFYRTLNQIIGELGQS